ncbi:ABC transporter substrate-binding protein [Nocardioides oleivorans]|nr:ABC transporter substrate-binding protein [Nocardioides oleivorans]
MTSRFRAAALVAASLALPLSACAGSSEAEPDTAADAPSGPWSFTDGSGEEVTLDETPTRIIAHGAAARALMSFGIKPVAIYADESVETDPNLRDLDLDGIEILGEEWGKIDVEKAASLRPDLIVADWWPAEEAHSGVEEGVEARSKKIAELAPMVGATQGDSILTLAETYEDLAESLGADVDDPAIAADKERFEEVRAEFEEVAKSRDDLSVYAMSPYEDQVYVANPEYAPELLDFIAWGLDLKAPDSPDADFPYWETLSMENADKYQPDLILWDDRDDLDNVGELNADYGKTQPTWFSVKAAEAGAVASWPAFWLHTYGDYATQLEELTDAIRDADGTVGD